MLASVSSLKDLIKQEIDSGIDPSRIVVGGFSQGGAISLLTGLSHTPSLGGIVGLSTWLPLRSRFSKKGVSNSLLTEKAEKIPTFLAHGDADPVVRFSWGEKTKTLLKEEIGTKDLSWNVYRGLQHGAHPQEVSNSPFRSSFIGYALLTRSSLSTAFGFSVVNSLHSVDRRFGTVVGENDPSSSLKLSYLS